MSFNQASLTVMATRPVPGEIILGVQRTATGQDRWIVRGPAPDQEEWFSQESVARTFFELVSFYGWRPFVEVYKTSIKGRN